MRITLRPVQDGDMPFLLRVYAGTRAEELAPLAWTPEQKAAFVAQQFAAQTAHYAQHYAGMSADVIVIDDVPVGRLLVDRRDDAILIVDISLLPEHRGRGAGSILLREVLDEAAAAGKRGRHLRRTLQPGAAPVRAARLPRGRRSRRLPPHGVGAR